MSKTRGIIVLAQNSNDNDYVLQACLLAMSIKHTNPNTKISVITNDEVKEEYISLFDNIIPIPYGDDAANSDWKIENRWKIYHASPYDQTIVMDTDMLVLQNLNSWWNFLSKYELFFTSKVYTYRGNLVTDDFYRKAFTANNLPNLYTGFHYFEKSTFAHEFYKWMELITQNWQLFYGQYVKEFYPSHPSMDITAAITAKILDCETEVTNTQAKYPSFTHMKTKIQDWTESKMSWQNNVSTYIDRDCKIRLGNYIQDGILHYTENNFVTIKILERYRNNINV